MHKEIEVVVAKSDDNQKLEHELMEAPDSFFTKITVQDVLEVSDNPDILKVLVGKVRRGGVLFLDGIDALDMCRRVHYGEISLLDASAQFFKTTNNLNSIATLKKYFTDIGWKVKFAALHNGRYSLEVVRK